MIYSDLNSNKKAFIFGLDNVLFPEKDYLLQIYYLFAGYIEYTELVNAKTLLDVMTATYYDKDPQHIFAEVKEKFNLDEKYRNNFDHLLLNAQLPLKLLLYKEMLTLLQDIVTDRKQIFIVTDKNPQLQLNKIKQTEWHGLDKYLTCYFTEELAPMQTTDVLMTLIKKHELKVKDVLLIGLNKADQINAQSIGAEYFSAEIFLT